MKHILWPVTGAAAFEVDSAVGVRAFRFNVSAIQTAGAVPSELEWSALAYGRDDTRECLCSGRLSVLLNAATEGSDPRMSRQKSLA